MNPFEFSFTLYGLLLGLALANLATGVADVWRDRAGVQWGVCTPLLALAILAFCLGQWEVVWVAQKSVVQVGPSLLLAMLSSTLPYVFLSRAMFPKDLVRWKSFDTYYLEHRGFLLACLMISPAVAILSNAILFRDFSLDQAERGITTIIVPAAAMPFRNRWIHAGAILIITFYYFVGRFLGLF